MLAHWHTSAEQPSLETLREAAEVLARGGIVAFPTDTLYGLAVDPWQAAAVERLFDVKGRAATQAIALIAANERQVADALGALPALAERLARRFWPGPLTLVVRAPRSLPKSLLAGGDTVGVRVPAHAVACGLAAALRRPITATSANVSGEPATQDPARVIATIGTRIDGVVDAGRSPGGPPSTVIDVSGGAPVLVRAGAIPWDRVVQFFPP